MEVGLVRSIDIDHEMQQAYLDYAMSVIVARALPDARDGLKPVHRRILYAMYDMGLNPDAAYKKSARIVGEVLGKYHPHGDMAVYEAMARMAQDFSMRYLLVDGQGNFGSVDGDPPAAMRYTEARLAAPASNLLADIQKNTVDFSDNFDGSLTEPDVLPAALPNLLVNGATGIAVGMSTSIPPHNLGEVIDALIFMLGKWEQLDDINVEDLMNFIQGPDFPTGGVIIQEAGDEGLTAAYGSGRGKITVQARAHIEEMSHGRNRIIVTELPYMTNKSSLIERIAELVREGRLEGVADLRDESDRQGLRIVIELTRTAEPEHVLQDLFKSTPMRSTFGIIMLALVDGEPRLLSLKQALRVYLEHRLVVIRRRSEYELEKARQRAHILEGLRVALKNLDEVIDLIRKAPDVETARTRLMKRFRLSEIQAQAILDMPLRRLAALERKKIEEEYKEVLVLIKNLEALLRSPRKMRELVSEELRVVKDAYGDRRRTQIAQLGKRSHQEMPSLVTDLTPERMVWVAVSSEGLVSRTLEDTPPKTSGRDVPAWLIHANTRDTLFLVTQTGEAAGVPGHAIPEAEAITDGLPYFKVSAIQEGNQLAGLFTLPPKDDRLEGWFVLTATQQGMVKKSSINELPGPTGKTFFLVKVNEDDRFGWVRLTNGKADILLATSMGMAIRFNEDEIRPMGLVAAGVGGIKLKAGDQVAGMELVPNRGEILFISTDGKGKRITAAQFPRQSRYGQGVAAWKFTRQSRLAGIATGKDATRLTISLDKLMPKSIRMDEVPSQTRTALGKPIIPLKAGGHVTGIMVPWDVPRPQAKTVSQATLEQPEAPQKRAPRSTSGSPPAEKATSQKQKTVTPVKSASAKPTQMVMLIEIAAPPKRKKPTSVKSATPSKTAVKKATPVKPAEKPAPKSAVKSTSPTKPSKPRTTTKIAVTQSQKPSTAKKSPASRSAASTAKKTPPKSTKKTGTTQKGKPAQKTGSTTKAGTAQKTSPTPRKKPTAKQGK